MKFASWWLGGWLSAGAVIGVLWLYGLNATPLSLKADILYHTEPIGEIYAHQTVGQTFLAPYNGLCRVDVSLADYGRRNSGTVEFTLRTAPDSAETWARSSFPAESIRGDVRQRIQFEPLFGSANRSYFFELRAAEAAPGNALTAYLQPEDVYPEGQAFFSGMPVAGDLVFVVYFCVPFWERTVLWLEQVSAGKAGVFGQTGFVTLLGVLSIVLLLKLWRVAGKL